MTDRELLAHFQKQPNGMWAVIKPVSIQGPNGSVGMGPGMSFGPGVAMMGIDMYAKLEAAARRLGR